MDVENFYTVAVNLHDTNSEKNEAINRTVVGRTYYAVYLATRDWLQQRFATELENAQGNSHEKYTICLLSLQRKYIDLNFSRLSWDLKTLKAQRTFADYEFDFQDIQTHTDTKATLLLGQKLLKDLAVLKAKYP